jgi:hypothetical protein
VIRPPRKFAGGRRDFLHTTLELSRELQVPHAPNARAAATALHRLGETGGHTMQLWRAFILLAVMVTPALIGSLAVMQLEGGAGFVVTLFASLVLMREATLICMILMRHWQFLGRDYFLIEQNGRHRWVDVFELVEIRQPCRIRARQFHPGFVRHHRRHLDH